ncbi:peptide/nickel transport system permease protein [Haloactinopolyspora alba]|uniref:Peptide/nickel transport system permease protein n=1 Tax=Haloactinopolyspora alba TaxID=648780 RepID=A0A2P8DX62_9ACTN|nr:ABC transporter permease [Haloactinopolyspora alba]PSL01820.1 peptide/nickel transport system permease protein [Haloactinopolyspora alba]
MSTPDQQRPGAGDEDQGIAVVARTQGQLVRRRFFRHRLAMISLVVFVAILVLSFSSTGIGPIPGWWKHDYTTIGTVVDGGRPTLSVVPGFLGGDGIHLGEHPFGQDNKGIDYFALTMRGTQISLMIAFIVGGLGSFIGVLIGAAAGFFRGWTETILMRFTDVIIIMPLLAIVAVIANQAGNAGPFWLAVVIALFTWTGLARIVRGEFLSLREKEFVEAARAAGTPAWRIIRKHILPNTLGVILVSATLSLAGAVILETALSFLGFGVKPPDTSLGRLVSVYQGAFVTRPWLFIWPGVFIVAIALTVNFIGDGLRDAFDPRQNKVRS